MTLSNQNRNLLLEVRFSGRRKPESPQTESFPIALTSLLGDLLDLCHSCDPFLFSPN